MISFPVILGSLYRSIWWVRELLNQYQGLIKKNSLCCALRSSELGNLRKLFSNLWVIWGHTENPITMDCIDCIDTVLDCDVISSASYTLPICVCRSSFFFLSHQPHQLNTDVLMYSGLVFGWELKSHYAIYSPSAGLPSEHKPSSIMAANLALLIWFSVG